MSMIESLRSYIPISGQLDLGLRTLQDISDLEMRLLYSLMTV